MSDKPEVVGWASANIITAFTPADMRGWEPLIRQSDYDTLSARVAELEGVLKDAEAALADIGDADREPGDDLAWCERRAALALPKLRAAIAMRQGKGESVADTPAKEGR